MCVLQEVRAGLVNESICVSVFSQFISPSVFEVYCILQISEINDERKKKGGRFSDFGLSGKQRRNLNAELPFRERKTHLLYSKTE